MSIKHFETITGFESTHPTVKQENEATVFVVSIKRRITQRVFPKNATAQYYYIRHETFPTRNKPVEISRQIA